MPDETDRKLGFFARKERFNYWFDSIVSNRSGQTKFLVIVCSIFVVISGVIEDQVNGPDDGIAKAIWESWLYMADPGVQSGAQSLEPLPGQTWLLVCVCGD
jgi:hypothetical protein